MPELTPIEQSRLDTGRRYYTIKKGFYNGFATSINVRRKVPKGQGTKSITNREVPEAENVPLDTTGNFRLLSYPEFRRQAGDEDIFGTNHPNIEELTKGDWEAMLPEPTPI